MTLLTVNGLLIVISSVFICTTIGTERGDRVLQYPYSSRSRDKRSTGNFEHCTHFSYGKKPHVKVAAHVVNTIEKNVTVTVKPPVTTTVKPVVTSTVTRPVNSTVKQPETSTIIPPQTSTVPTSHSITSTSTNATDKNTFSFESVITKTSTVSSKKSTSDEVTTETVLKKFDITDIEAHHLTATVGSYWNEKNVYVHVTYVNNPLKTLSVYEPLHDGTCRKDGGQTATVLETAKARGCVVTVNAGLFNTSSGKCYGNIVSDGRLVQDSEGVQNAHFGITEDGSLFFGYLSEIDIVAERFQQLVGGVIWVLKDGEEYVDESIATECRDTEETGTLQRFASVVSARTIVAHDEYGRVMIVQIDGKTDTIGASLYEAAEILKKLGAINAINLDGGGSSTLVINNTLVSYPSDWCDAYQCMRNVTTVLCAHEPYCEPWDCEGHGICQQGECRCHGYWTGSACDTLACPDDCHENGICATDGCHCFPGFHGENCSESCDPGWHGNQCTQRCACEHGGNCNSKDGSCRCLAGYTGKLCQYRCPYGFYGDNCSNVCSCESVCQCDHVTGSCNETMSHKPDPGGGVCILEIEKDVGSGVSWTTHISAIASLSALAVISISINLVFLWRYCCRSSHVTSSQRTASYQRVPSLHNGARLLYSGTHHSSFSTSTTSDEETAFIKR